MVVGTFVVVLPARTEASDLEVIKRGELQERRGLVERLNQDVYVRVECRQHWR